MDDMDVAMSLNNLESQAKNVLLFIGDGLGPNTLTAARIYGKKENGYLSFEKFPHMGALKARTTNLNLNKSSVTFPPFFICVKISGAI